jgi:flagellar hook-associated protein FlgK
MGIQGLSYNVLGMQVSQAGLRITNHNIANSTNNNYSRKLLLQNTVVAQDVGLKKIATGVKVEDVIRAKNNFLDNQYRENLQQQAFFEKLEAINSQMTSILGEPSEQLLVKNLQDFYKTANDLNQNPENATNRQAFINSAKGLTNAFNSTHRSLDIIKESLNAKGNGELKKTIDILNIKFQKLSLAQKQINILRANSLDVSSLEDERDAQLNDINKYSDLNIKVNQAGDFYQVRVGVHPSPNEEAKIQGTVMFSNLDSPIIPAITAGNRQLDLSINNGNGSTVNFMVNLPENASIRDTVKSINEHFRAAGGKGSIASVDSVNKLVLENRLIENAQINPSNSITINPTTASILTTLGLPAAPVTVNGSSALDMSLVDTSGVNYILDIDYGNDKITDGVLASKLILKQNGIKQGTIEVKGGILGAQFKAINESIPKAKEELSIIAMGLKNTINSLLKAGTTLDGNPGQDLFTGSNAGNFSVSNNIMNNTTLLAVGELKNSGGISLGENSIINKITDLFNDKGALISTTNSAEKFYLKANDTNYQISKLPVISGADFNIDISGLISDGANTFNAGDNGLAANSLVQVHFLDANQNPLGAALNMTGTGIPNTSVTWKGLPPAGASFISVKINDTSFNDNNASNNYGHFEVEITNKNDTDNLSTTLNAALLTSIDRIAIQGADAKHLKDVYTDISEALNTQIQSIQGVNMEDEAANLLMFQKAFGANSRAFSAVNQSIEDIFTFIS